MYLKVMMLTPFSLLAPELSNPDPNNDVFAYLFTQPRCHKTSMISLSSCAMFPISPKIQYVPCSLYFLSLDLDPATGPSPPTPEWALIYERAPLQVLSALLLSPKTPCVISTFLAEVSSPTPCSPLRQLLHQSHLAQSRRTWLFGTKKEGKKCFADHSEVLGGTLRTWGNNSFLLFPEGSHPSAIYRHLCTRKNPLHTE